MSLQNSSRQLLRNAVRPTLIRPAAALPSRDISTQTLSPEQNLELLNKQRALRPNSPWHIYQKQLTSATSLANRGTGVGIAGGMYLMYLGTLFGPALGFPIDSSFLISTFADLPEAVKLSVKSAVALPVAYHTINGFRHLAWDTGKLMELKTSYAAGYAVMGSSVVAAAGLVYLGM